MEYKTSAIHTSQEIISAILANSGALKRQLYPELFDTYVSDQKVQQLVNNQVEYLDSSLVFSRDVIYLIPNTENRFFGYSKNELQSKLCKGDSRSVDYYLAEFVILVLLLEFFSDKNYTKASRSYIKRVEFMESVKSHLLSGVKANEDRDPEDIEIDFEGMHNAYEALRNEEGSSAKTTKEGFIDNILIFLENQGLVKRDDDKIYRTEKLRVLVESHLINKERLDEVRTILEDIDNESN